MIARPNCAPPVIHAIVALLNMLLSVASPSATAATFVVKPSVLCRRASETKIASTSASPEIVDNTNVSGSVKMTP